MVESDQLTPKEIPGHQKVALIFDIDGVLTHPDTKKANETLVDFLANQLESGNATALVTGRALEWAKRTIINNIESRLNDKSKLANLFVSAEHGGVTATFENGVEHLHKRENLDLPKEDKEKIRELLVDGRGVFYDEEKQTMVSLEIEGEDENLSDEENKEKTKREKEELARLKSVLDETYPEDDEKCKYKVIKSEIAVDVLSKATGKGVAAAEFLEFLEERKIDPAEFIMFGDSPSDAEVTDELHSRGKNAKFAYVGTQEFGDKPYGKLVEPGAFDKGTLAILAQEGYI